MADGINLNLGTEGGALDNSSAKIGNVTGGDSIVNNYGNTNDPHGSLFSDRFYTRLMDHEQRLVDLEKMIGGGRLGEEGIVQRLRALQKDTRDMQDEIDLIALVDNRTRGIEIAFNRYAPMWESMFEDYQESRRNNVKPLTEDSLKKFGYWIIGAVVLASVILVILPIIIQRTF